MPEARSIGISFLKSMSNREDSKKVLMKKPSQLGCQSQTRPTCCICVTFNPSQENLESFAAMIANKEKNVPSS